MIKSRRMRRAKHVPSVGKKNANRVLMGKPLEKPRRRWQDNIKMDLDK
jgi:hypothetical protein